MKKTLIIAICCILPIIIIGFLLSRGNQKGSPAAQQQMAETSADSATVGNAFPAFSLTDIDGQSISNDTLKGKPTIIWFTTTWCTPCQVGAKKVAQLQNELGDNRLNVLVFFVDTKESADDLRNWRSQFANPDWKLVFNNGLAEKISIQFLDSKYLLDKDSVIKNFDTQLVNQQYLDLIKSTVK